MAVPTLRQLVVNLLAEDYCVGDFYVPKGFDETSSNALFAEIQRLADLHDRYPDEEEEVEDEHYYSDSDDEFMYGGLREAKKSLTNMNLSRADFSYRFIKKYEFKMLESCELKELKLGHLAKLKPYYEIEKCIKNNIHEKDDLYIFEDESVTNLQEALRDCTKNSLQSLVNLTIVHCDTFVEHWVDQVLNLLPNLKRFAIFGTVLSLSTLTKSYPQLSSLDISDTDVPNLCGISNLVNLVDLNIGTIRFHKKEDIEELFMLKHLAVLDVSTYNLKNDGELGYPPEDSKIKMIEQFLAHKRSIPSLREFYCEYTDMNASYLAHFLALHPNLEKICFYKTRCAHSKPTGLKVLSVHTLESAIELLLRYNKLSRPLMMMRVYKDLENILEFNTTDYKKNEQCLEQLFDHLVITVNKIPQGRHVETEDLWAIKMLRDHGILFIKYMAPEKRICLVNTLLSCERPLAWTILRPDVIPEVANLDMLVAYRKSVDYFVNNEPHLFDVDDVIAMMKNIKNLHNEIPAHRMPVNRRIVECIHRLCFVLEEVISEYVQNEIDEKLHLFAKTFDDAMDTLFSQTEESLGLHLLNIIVNFMERCDDTPCIKLSLMKVVHRSVSRTSLTDLYGIVRETSIMLSLARIPIEETTANIEDAEIRDHLIELAESTMKIVSHGFAQFPYPWR